MFKSANMGPCMKDDSKKESQKKLCNNIKDLFAIIILTSLLLLVLWHVHTLSFKR